MLQLYIVVSLHVLHNLVVSGPPFFPNFSLTLLCTYILCSEQELLNAVFFDVTKGGGQATLSLQVLKP